MWREPRATALVAFAIALTVFGAAPGVGIFIGTAWVLSLLVTLTWRSLHNA